MSLQDDIDRQQRNKNPFHRFYLKYNPYCDKCSGPIPATCVGKVGFKTVALCDAHARAFFPIEFGLKQRAKMEAK